MNRALEIDATKGILVIGMTFAHCIQFLYSGESSIIHLFSRGTNLVSFSGFYFCFGFALWSAYLSKKIIPWASVIKTALKCYLAFVFSGLAFTSLIEKSPEATIDIINILLLLKIPGYSEFLISFGITTIITCFAKPLIEISTRSLTTILVSSLLCLSATLLPDTLDVTAHIGLLIGGRKFSYFPIIQYYPLLLAGIFLARTKKKFSIPVFSISIAGATTWILLQLLHVEIDRFPPSAVFLILSFAPVYIYYSIGLIISQNKHSAKLYARYIISTGQNSLIYLVISNISIFAVALVAENKSLTLIQVSLAFSAIMIFIFFIQSSIVHIQTPKPLENNENLKTSSRHDDRANHVGSHSRT